MKFAGIELKAGMVIETLSDSGKKESWIVFPMVNSMVGCVCYDREAIWEYFDVLKKNYKIIRIKNQGGPASFNSGDVLWELKNPIIDNRIVSDKTFARRLLSFLEKTSVHDLMSEEELEYLMSVAEKLLEYQKATMTKDEEIQYFKNLEK